jgi:NADPH:quinone reductase-like Zn-dependent oxidoreductase
VGTEQRSDAGDSLVPRDTSGGVGSFAVQVAKAFGAEVTGVQHRNLLDNPPSD